MSKLYCTVLSERARKGQGGNKDILAVFTAMVAGARQEVASMSLVVTEYGYNFQYRLPDGVEGHIKIAKGEKPRAEKCYCECELSIPHYH